MDTAQIHQKFALPEGWIVELNNFKSGKKAGRIYKSYYNPSTGIRCYSTKEVLRRMTDGQGVSESQGLASNCESVKTNNTEFSHSAHANVLYEYSPKGLPPGWIQEIRCTENASGQRRDSYYIDPATQLVFRSKKDVFRYLESGEIGKHAFKRKSNLFSSPRSSDHGSTFKSPVEPPGVKSVQNPSTNFHKCTAIPIHHSYPAAFNMPDSSNGNTRLVQLSKSARLDPTALKSLPWKRFKMLVKRRPFKRMQTNLETQSDEESSLDES